MKTIRIKVYSFNELSNEAQKKAIQDYLNSDNESFAWDDIKEDAKEIGLKLITLNSRNRNDGEFLLSANEVANKIIFNHGESCETYKTAKSFIDDVKMIENTTSVIFDEGTEYKYEDYSERENLIDERTDEFLQSLLEDYRIMYDRQIEYEYSDEYAKESILANDYTFTKDGKLFN